MKFAIKRKKDAVLVFASMDARYYFYVGSYAPTEKLLGLPELPREVRVVRGLNAQIIEARRLLNDYLEE